MSLININNSKDPNFRYKINHIEVSYTGTGTQKGYLTNLLNLQIICEQINHNPKTVIKYLGMCVGSKSNDNKFWIQGHHKESNLQKYIFDYIKCYVICPKCSIPELKYNLENKILIKTYCIGCGSNNIIESNILGKNNKKIFDKILKDIKEKFFNKQTYTSKLEDSIINSFEEFIPDDDFF